MAVTADSAFAQNEVEPLLSGYRTLPGIFDEMMDRDGRVRAHWRPLLAMLAGLGPKEIGRRFAAADEPPAAVDRRGGMARPRSRSRPARRTARGGAGRRLWTGRARARREAPRRHQDR